MSRKPYKIYSMAEVIGMLRQQCRLKSQVVMANEMGVSEAYIARLLNGTRQPGPTVLQYFGLAKEEPTYKKAS